MPDFDPQSLRQNWCWADADDPMQALDLLRERTPGPSGFILSYWENQSGGSGWQWRLWFTCAEEVIDFLTVAYPSLSCTNELIEENEVFSAIRETFLRDLAAGMDVAKAMKPMRKLVNDVLWGEIECIMTTASLLTGSEGVDERREYWENRADEGELDNAEENAASFERPIPPELTDDFLQQFFEMY